MKSDQVVYYECESGACGLRFPEYVHGLLRERCPVCREKVRAVLFTEKVTLEGQPAHVTSNLPQLHGLLDNIRSTYNVGSIFRTADGIGLQKLFLCGITPTPDAPGVSKTALGGQISITWEQAMNGLEKVRQLKSSGYQVWGLENTADSVSLFDSGAQITAQPLVLVVGNEVCGIDPQILAACDRVVSIPMVGKKQSYNVSVAFGIAASYLRYCQMLSTGSLSKLPNTKSLPCA